MVLHGVILGEFGKSFLPIPKLVSLSVALLSLHCSPGFADNAAFVVKVHEQQTASETASVRVNAADIANLDVKDDFAQDLGIDRDDGGTGDRTDDAADIRVSFGRARNYQGETSNILDRDIAVRNRILAIADLSWGQNMFDSQLARELRGEAAGGDDAAADDSKKSGGTRQHDGATASSDEGSTTASVSSTDTRRSEGKKETKLLEQLALWIRSALFSIADRLLQLTTGMRLTSDLGTTFEYYSDAEKTKNRPSRSSGQSKRDFRDKKNAIIGALPTEVLVKNILGVGTNIHSTQGSEFSNADLPTIVKHQTLARASNSTMLWSWGRQAAVVVAKLRQEVTNIAANAGFGRQDFTCRVASRKPAEDDAKSRVSSRGVSWDDFVRTRMNGRLANADQRDFGFSSGMRSSMVANGNNLRWNTDGPFLPDANSMAELPNSDAKSEVARHEFLRLRWGTYSTSAFRNYSNAKSKPSSLFRRPLKCVPQRGIRQKRFLVLSDLLRQNCDRDRPGHERDTDFGGV